MTRGHGSGGVKDDADALKELLSLNACGCELHGVGSYVHESKVSLDLHTMMS